MKELPFMLWVSTIIFAYSHSLKKVKKKNGKTLANEASFLPLRHLTSFQITLGLNSRLSSNRVSLGFIFKIRAPNLKYLLDFGWLISWKVICCFFRYQIMGSRSIEQLDVDEEMFYKLTYGRKSEEEKIEELQKRDNQTAGLITHSVPNF